MITMIIVHRTKKTSDNMKNIIRRLIVEYLLKKKIPMTKASSEKIRLNGLWINGKIASIIPQPNVNRNMINVFFNRPPILSS